MTSLNVRVASYLDRQAAYLLLCGVAISIAVTLPRFTPGIPMSVDTTSHLYRVLFLSEWIRRGVFPYWSPDWYAGSPTLLLYPPLGYFLAVAVSLLGVEPVLAYEIIDAAFYCATPIVLFYLVKEFGFSNGESALSAAFYSVVPEVIENYLFYDRFPTVVAIPFFCAFLVTFHRSLHRSRRATDLLASILLMSCLLLTHHLSALIAGMVAILIIAVERRRGSLIRAVSTLVAIAIGTMLVSAFWLVPFTSSLSLFSGNAFYNRNVVFPFIGLSYFGVNVVVYLLGIVQFLLAMFSIHLILPRFYGHRIGFSILLFFSLILVAMALYDIGNLMSTRVLAYSGQLLLISTFLCFLGQFLFVAPYQNRSEMNRIFVMVFWFVAFFWVGLGYYALPILWLPYVREVWVRTMDVYRIWLYAAVPMSALASAGVVGLLRRTPKRLAVSGLLILLAAPITAGVLLKTNYALTAPVNGVLPYSAANAQIPARILEYFRNDNSTGRILGINVPFWIYVLPNYVDKPILDGWYPQTKLVTKLVKINDYRIDDLETTPNATRIMIWRHLISDASALDITWVMIGGRNLAEQLMQPGNFVEQLSLQYSTAKGFIDLVIYKAVRVPSFIDIDSPGATVIRGVSQPNPDTIMISFGHVAQATEVLVKEAYFPTWRATADGGSLRIIRENSTGYMIVQIPAGVTDVTIYQNPGSIIWNWVSTIAIVLCCFSLGLSLRQDKRST